MSARCEVSEQKQMAKPKEATRGSYDEDVLFEKQEGKKASQSVCREMKESLFQEKKEGWSGERE
jgi:hypothetical protein